MCCVYILKCLDGSFYIGSTSDIESRIELHDSGKASAYTRARLPVRLVYTEPQPTRSRAVKRERQLKGWTCAKKQALIDGDLAALRQLSHCRSKR